MKQKAMNPEDSAQLTAQLKLWKQQQLIRPINRERNSALLSVAKKNTVAKRFIIDLRPLNAKCKKINLYIGSVEQNPQILHVIKVVSAVDMSNGFGVLWRKISITSPSQPLIKEAGYSRDYLMGG